MIYVMVLTVSLEVLLLVELLDKQVYRQGICQKIIYFFFKYKETKTPQ